MKLAFKWFLISVPLALALTLQSNITYATDAYKLLLDHRNSFWARNTSSSTRTFVENSCPKANSSTSVQKATQRVYRGGTNASRLSVTLLR